MSETPNAKTTAYAALFDLDGVIVDTESQYTEFWREIGRKFIPENPSFAAEIKGRTLVEIERKYFSHIPEALQEITKGLDALEARMEYTYIPGVEAFIRILRKHGVRMAIVTSSNQKKMDRVSAVHPELGKLFDRILKAEDFSRSKPDPDCYLKAAKALDEPIDRCVVFEDSATGLEAGRNAGMRVVGLYTTLPREEVEKRSDIVIQNYLQPEAEEILCKYFGIVQ
jgi:beta-phosphoglucomutase